jgi:hypothetical protein
VSHPLEYNIMKARLYVCFCLFFIDRKETHTHELIESVVHCNGAVFSPSRRSMCMSLFSIQIIVVVCLF